MDRQGGHRDNLSPGTRHKAVRARKLHVSGRMIQDLRVLLCECVNMCVCVSVHVSVSACVCLCACEHTS